MDGGKNLYGRMFYLKNKENSLESTIKTILSLPPQEKDAQRLKDLGVKKDKINLQTVMLEALVQKAAKGEVTAIKEVLSILDSKKEQSRPDISVLYKALQDED